MGPEDSIKAINYLKPQRVIPCHYNTFPVIEIDTQQWVKSVNEKTEAIPVILKVGESAIL
jgi:L-ascorbate metabolism protein UlaG (beta-lactamase superfamily)